jgi:hypothetical protein
MLRLIHPKRFSLILSLAALVLSPVGLWAQNQSQNQANLTLQDVKDRLNQNKDYLKQAQKSGKAGDAAGLQTALDNFDRSTEGLNQALSSGHFNGTPDQQEEALSRVADATSKHTKTLTNLLNKVPSQAQPAIQRAILVSQKGHETATAHLQEFHAQHPNLGQSGGMGQGMSQNAGRFGAPGGSAGGPPAGRPSGGHGRP